jgi:hypothetical protein
MQRALARAKVMAYSIFIFSLFFHQYCYLQPDFVNVLRVPPINNINRYNTFFFFFLAGLESTLFIVSLFYSLIRELCDQYIVPVSRLHSYLYRQLQITILSHINFCDNIHLYFFCNRT